MRWLMRRLRVVLLLLVALIVTLAAFTYAGVVDVSADGAHGRVTAWWLATVRERSVSRAAADVNVRLPETMDEDMLQTAVVGYEDMCVACHAAPGREPGALAQGLSPRPPDLVRLAPQRSPAELFWATKHGIRMTGMPAWGVTHADEELWPLVALIRHFPEMSGGDYTALLDRARAAGIEHDHDHDHGHSDHGDHDHDHGAGTDGAAHDHGSEHRHDHGDGHSDH